MIDESESLIREVLVRANALIGDGEVRLEIVSRPVIEWVYVAIENDHVVVSDKGETFARIGDLRGDRGEFVDWSPERALTVAGAFGVSLVDETHRDAQGMVLATGWRLVRTVAPGDSVSDAVQSVAHAVDGVLAVHTVAGALTEGSHFWDHRDDGAMS